MGDVAVTGDSISAVGDLSSFNAQSELDGEGLALAPGFIDTHTHDDLMAIRQPGMLPKLSQGVTTVVVGNCGIAVSPMASVDKLPEPMNLLGEPDWFRYPTFKSYVEAVKEAMPALNVAALVGHTTLRANHMDRLDRLATANEIEFMKAQLQESLDHGALGLSTGLAYRSAICASTDEVVALAGPLAAAGAIYATHMRNEGDQIIQAIQEATEIGRSSRVPIVLSHLKCYGIDNWGRSSEVVEALNLSRQGQEIYWDCYPYAASSTTLDSRQIDERVTIVITGSKPHPEVTGMTLAKIAEQWGVSQIEAARTLQPAGAIYHSMSEDDVARFLSLPGTMIGSDGLPNDPHPHPRLWGTFPRVLGHYVRDKGLFPLSEAVRKMTCLPATRFGFTDRGLIREGRKADLVLFSPERIKDRATFQDPTLPAEGIEGVWVNGVHTYSAAGATGNRGGRFLKRESVHELGC